MFFYLKRKGFLDFSKALIWTSHIPKFRVSEGLHCEKVNDKINVEKFTKEVLSKACSSKDYKKYLLSSFLQGKPHR